MKFLPPVLDPDAVPGKPAPLIPVMGRLTPSAIPVIGLPPAVPFLAVPILPAPVFVLKEVIMLYFYVKK